MLWKPYKKKGLSGCFQPKWDGPWVIDKFTGSNLTNCKIVNCDNPSKKLNVHVSQLKLVKGRDTSCASRSVDSSNGTDKSPSASPTEFFDYFEDFGLDDQRIAPEAVGDGDQPQPYIAVDEPREVPALQRDLIGRHWVTVDPSNIVAGPRTRGGRLDYED